ncbi:hypothetical protein F0562_030839 [Nyssa sinensis]|uniref:Uncharacterized protein n=1 Tax=Nyssa sinensis TaxID=561372 RepID=A0A5J5B3Z8_9ASTE|nr:hypothetical protein F0562_030839 [Nyssa sinensis]
MTWQLTWQDDVSDDGANDGRVVDLCDDVVDDVAADVAGNFEETSRKFSGQRQKRNVSKWGLMQWGQWNDH